MATLASGRASAGMGLKTPLNLVATGWGLTSALVGLFILCFALSFAWPAGGGSHAWVRLFASQPDSLTRMFVEGVLGCAAAAWVAAALFVPVYNRLAER
ncbi:hypothetical protein [Methylobacterium nonmethylotrophicum]|uniref:Uncharacterized protein n=1 Tax=Methylobacterium nonmethylotrophicum TaxID=1141884 RepID=A0A4Z0NMT5_9HYPH|nr:hypothetical protein [Methylobacterium nonmethylotrophicum]TGD97705.1 hypothetical protein EU555_18915 [Methylobacterium nonmethylotrophicum]